MKDVFGNKLTEGDEVAFMISYYTDLKIGEVIGFTTTRVKIAFKCEDGVERTTLILPKNVSLSIA